MKFRSLCMLSFSLMVIGCSDPADPLDPDPDPPPVIPPVVPPGVDSVFDTPADDPAIGIALSTAHGSSGITEVRVYDPQLRLKWEDTLSLSPTNAPGLSYANGKLFLQRQNELRGYDFESGRLIWNVSPPGTYYSNLVPYLGKLYTVTLGKVYEVDPATGSYSTWATVTQAVPAPPTIVNNTMYVISATPLAVYSVHAIDCTTREEKWVRQLSTNPPGGFSYKAGKLLYITSFGGQLRALDPATGNPAWSRTDQPFGTFIAGKDRIYAWGTNNPNSVQALDPATGTTIWTWTQAGSLFIQNLYLTRSKIGFIFTSIENISNLVYLDNQNGLERDRRQQRSTFYGFFESTGDKVYTVEIDDNRVQKLFSHRPDNFATVDSVRVPEEVNVYQMRVIKRSEN